MTSATGQALAHPGKTYEAVKNMMSLLKSNKPKEKLFAQEALKAFTLMAAKGSVIPAATVAGTVATTKGLDSLFNKKGSVKTAANPFAMLSKILNRGIAKIAPNSAIGKAYKPVLRNYNISDEALIDLFKNKYKGVKGQNELQKLLGKNVINPNQLQQARISDLMQELSAMRIASIEEYSATAEKLRELMGRKRIFKPSALDHFINSPAYNKYLNAQNAISKNPYRAKRIINDQLQDYRSLYLDDTFRANVKARQDAVAKQKKLNKLVGATAGAAAGAGGALGIGAGYALNNRNP